MATASSFLSEDQCLCSICLDVFTDPVTIPCGHNFCKKCITQHWNIKCQCPLCKELFNTRPELRVNTCLSEIAAQFRQSGGKEKSSSISEKQQSKAGDVLCDVCTETKQRAVKSCLVCLTSYCETHLEPHHRVPGLKRHQLINPVDNLEDRMCKEHDRPLELFCKTEQMCVCHFCTKSDHKLHPTVPLIEEHERQKAELGKTEADVQQMIQERQMKMEELKHSVKISKECADREKTLSVQTFTALIKCVEKSLAELIDVIEEKQKTREKQTEGFIKELEEEICELMKRSSELKKLSHTEDHLHFLQSFPSLNTVPPSKDWTKVRVHSSYEGTVKRAVVQLEETLSKEMKTLCNNEELKRVQQYGVDVTLDPETANIHLILSDDGKQVRYGDKKQKVPDSPKRFSYFYVLGKQSFSSGRFYYEVQVKNKTHWSLGVARESVDRKKGLNRCWMIFLSNGTYYKFTDSSVCISVKTKPQKVGVFVDYEEGLISFYDVDAAALMHSFTDCNFTEKLYPYFNPCNNLDGKNSTPLIICPISHSD